MRFITFDVPESKTPHKGFVLRFYSDCGHRMLVRDLIDNTTRFVDLVQLRGTKTLKMRS